ncbi:MAG: hypothetical protein MUC96_35675 [Myxococcaceae bacterium]|jgi:hypothetical protein|nr:hypothetical protein [Myxococcaceae bacterium]
MTRRLVLSSLVALAACGMPPPRMEPPTPQPSAEPLPAFALLDVNPASPTSGQQVGPTRYRGKVSGWYFTHTN